MNPYAIVYPFLTSGHTADMKNATMTTANPNVINKTNKIKNGVLVNRSNWNMFPKAINPKDSISTNIKEVIIHDVQYAKCDNPMTVRPYLSFLPFSYKSSLIRIKKFNK